jgi:hypothetical protein
MLRPAMRRTARAVSFVAALAAGGWATGCGSRTGLDLLLYGSSDNGGPSDSGAGTSEPVVDGGAPTAANCGAQTGLIPLAPGGPVGQTVVDIVVDANNVYWTTNDGMITSNADGYVLKVPACGGTPTVLASGWGGSFGLAADSANVYWAAYAGLLKVPVGGGTPVTLSAGPLSASAAIALSGANVYWAGGGICGPTGCLLEMPKSGGAATVLATVEPLSIATDPTSLYWVTGDSVMRLPLLGGSPTVLASGQTIWSGMALDSSSVYWVSTTFPNPDPSDPSTVSVLKMPLGGGQPVTLASIQGEPISCVAVDSESVYWSGRGLMKVPIGGGSVTTLVPSSPSEGALVECPIAVDATSVYAARGGQVMKLTPK